MNKVMIIGNITRDPELKEIGEKNLKVTLMTVATNRNYNKDWEKQQEAEFHSVVAYGKLAEIIANHLKKWNKVFVEWRLRTRQREDSDGNKKYKTEIIAENVEFLSSKK